MAFDLLAEALVRVEHKVDILLQLITLVLGEHLPMPQVKDNNICPVCSKPIRYYMDVIRRAVVRDCGCGTGLLAPSNLDLFAPIGEKHGKGNTGNCSGESGSGGSSSGSI